MRTPHYRYPVRLSKEQYHWLETMVHTSRTPAKHYLVARVLLMSDQSQQENLEVALTGSFLAQNVPNGGAWMARERRS